jgi:hypothetical protein
LISHSSYSLECFGEGISCLSQAKDIPKKTAAASLTGMRAEFRHGTAPEDILFSESRNQATLPGLGAPSLPKREKN